MAFLSDKSVGDIVKIRENGTAVNYIIVHKGKPSSLYDDSCDGIWLLRESIHSNIVWDGTSSSYNNDYENSEIKIWLNNTFLNTIDEKIRAEIKTVKIPFKKGNGNSSSSVYSGSNGLSCKVFLLSGYELGWTTSDNSYFPVDGARLSYFENGTGTSANNKRIAKLNGSAAFWWLRSPRADNAGGAWGVSTGGSYGGGGAYGSRGARPALILSSSLLIDSDGFVSTNSLPSISCDKSGNLGTLNNGFTCNYSVDDADATDSVTVTLDLDGKQIDSYTAVKNQTETYTLGDNEWLKVTNGEHTFNIVASDGKDSATNTITFTRNLTELAVTLSNPFPADDRISACALNVEGSIPADAVCKFEVTNNALDSTPVWEDCTKKSQAGFSYVFSNKSAENGFAFNFRVTVSRGASGLGGFISNISGGFE